MSDWEELIPRPISKFLRVRCRGCEGEQIVFSHTSNLIKCRNCGEVLAEPKGGKADIKGIVISELG